MKRTALLLPVLLLALGCPAADSAGAGQAPPALEPGQRYRFEQASAADTEQVLEVIAVNPDAVLYRVQTTVRGEAVAEPTPPLVLRFPRWPSSTPEEDAAPLTVGGRTFTCRVTQVGALQIYTALNGANPAFPGVVKITQGEDVCYRLVAIEAK